MPDEISPRPCDNGFLIDAATETRQTLFQVSVLFAQTKMNSTLSLVLALLLALHGFAVGANVAARNGAPVQQRQPTAQVTVTDVHEAPLPGANCPLSAH